MGSDLKKRITICIVRDQRGTHSKPRVSYLTRWQKSRVLSALRWSGKISLRATKVLRRETQTRLLFLLVTDCSLEDN